MSREEAIAIIRKEYLCVDRDCDIDRSCGKCDLMMPSKEPILQTYDMAIQALSQEPCTDAVSRQAVIYYIKGHIHEIITESGTDKNAHTNSILRALINGVETMPSVTQKSGKGSDKE